MEQTGWIRETSPFHSGEQALQDRLGMKEQQEHIGKQLMRDYMPEQHREFFSELPFIIAGSVDDHGSPWASMLVGKPGFVSTPTSRTLNIAGGQIEGDPFWENSKAGKPLGFVGIELPTRRRNRINGVVSQSREGVEVKVSQSFGNCPKYIHTRDLEEVRNPQETYVPDVSRFTQLPKPISEYISNTDTFFVASSNLDDDINDTGGVDVSHRGGKPGFIKVDGDTLTIPDYSGNFIFNTFGNFLVNPKAGLIFIDFSSGDIIQLTGTVELIWEGNPELDAFEGAERGWIFHLHHGHVLHSAAPYKWKLNEYSPFVESTSDWSETSLKLDAINSKNLWHKFRVIKTVDESSVIRSIYLRPDENIGLPNFKPGQFIALRVQLPGSDTMITRTYTLSSAPSDDAYRISVKRDGVVSNFIHDNLKQSSQLEIRLPSGTFWMDTEETRPAVLLAAGVGITPMVSMVREAYSSRNTHSRTITLIHAAKTTKQRAFANEFTKIQASNSHLFSYVSVISQVENEETPGLQYHAEGRLSRSLLKQLLSIDDYDFYLCGPPSFMQNQYEALISLGVADKRIFAEGFGPASIDRIKDKPNGEKEPMPMIATEAVVTFDKSQVEQGWTIAEGTLLEFAESHGLQPEFSCRNGNCGACLTKVKSGSVAYTKKPSFETSDDEILLCCAVPAESDSRLVLKL